MKLLMDLLAGISEYEQLLGALDAGASPAAVAGLAPAQRAYFAAGLWRDTGRPVVLLCADDAEVERMAADLKALTGQPVLTLPAREFTFHNAAVVSRQWEHRRLEVLWALSRGQVPLLVASAEAVLQRTIPKALLAKASRVLKMGETYDLNDLAETLTAAGYSRCEQVEGVGQFALRGGILDFFSPAHPQPVRMELFGDEVDSMGLFDVSTQRRTVQLDEARILPAAEVLPQLADGGLAGLCAALDKEMAAAEKKGAPDGLLTTLRQDREMLANGLSFPAIDRYLALIYPKLSTAVDYLPEDATVLISESPRFMERCKNYLWQLNEDVTALTESGTLAARLGTFCATGEELTTALDNWPVAYLDSFTSSQYPSRPRSIFTVTEIGRASCRERVYVLV